MPRTDEGDGGLNAPDRSTSKDLYFEDYSDRMEEDPVLVELERRLNEEVEEDFFAEPKTFDTLHRVIDVLGLQMIDDATVQSAHRELDKNPAYRNLKEQQKIVEGAIEHMAVIHCTDLNGSVIRVGRVARQFSDAVSRVRQLRKQVRDIQDTLGASGQSSNPNDPVNKNNKASTNTANRSQNAAAMSLRELWLKKLECEATLALLEKLDVIRAAPARFDQYVQPPCRIGAAVLSLSRAFDTMFSDDVAQVQALHKIMEQLFVRKQRAEEILWDTLGDVIYLRTANGLPAESDWKSFIPGMVGSSAPKLSSVNSVSSDNKRTNTGTPMSTAFHSNNTSHKTSIPGIMNPFVGPQRRYAVDDDADDDSVGSDASGASLFSLEDDQPPPDGPKSGTTPVGSLVDGSTGKQKRYMIPATVVEADLDLEEDERRCLEEIALSGMNKEKKTATSMRQRQLPRYADPVLALRIIVECLAKLKRLDDIERVLAEGLEREIRQIVQREQARTFSRLEKRRVPGNVRVQEKSENLKVFRRHLTGLLSAFGCVLLRLYHLAEILRFRISTEKDLIQKIQSPSSLMRSVLAAAHDIMQREVREFLNACLQDNESTRNDGYDSSVRKGSAAYESGLFSLGIIESGPKSGTSVVSTATRSNVMEMRTGRFVTGILFAKTRVEPHARHALVFRRSVARWTSELDTARKELASLTGEDTSAPSYKASMEKAAIMLLDDVIQRQLLPALQGEAVDGTIKGLERRDAFDPVLDRTLYSRQSSNAPQDVDMCTACQYMFEHTSPLFMALHRLPRDGEMYMQVVAVLEHVVLTFTSRVKQQVEKVSTGKTALDLVMGEGTEDTSLCAIMERRRPFKLLLQAYADGDVLESTAVADEMNQQPGLIPLAPPSTDTARRQGGDLHSETPIEEIGDGVEGEEACLQFELSYLNPFLEFALDGPKITTTSDEELMRAACLAHSLLKLASLLESRLKLRGNNSSSRSLTSTRALREAIKIIKTNGVKMAMFCRLDMLLQTLVRLSKVCRSSTLVSRDAVRIPSSVNDLGEYLTGTSDNLREAAGNAIAAYTLSSLEQYIPFLLMQTVRTIALGKGVIEKTPLTMNGIESLDRSGSVLYRDLKAATGFDNSFWDVELAAVSFERCATFLSLMELEMEELVAFYTANREDFSEPDFELMFKMTGPRRRGDVSRFHLTKRQLA